jgi:D-alanyl-D-alanine carboxypeptidase (penicillin-binding protein 5/6)
MNKKLSIALIIITFLISFTSKSFAKINLNSKSAILVEVNSGKILYEDNKDQVLPQASITKLMTYYILMDFFKENLISQNDKVKVYIEPNSIPSDGSQLKLKNGDELTVKQLVESMLIVSANDSAVQLERMYNNEADNDIVKAMNDKAKKLGMNKTKFINTSGLTEKTNGIRYNYTTAYETALLSMNLIKDYPNTLKITSQKTFTYKGLKFENTNKLLKIKPEVDGLKTGHTNEAGYCLVSTEDITKTNGNGKPFRLLAVVLGAKTEEGRIKDSLKLLKYGEENFVNEKVIEKEYKFTLNSELYKDGKISGSVKDDVYLIKRKDSYFTKEVKFNEKLPSNIKKEDKIGKVIIKNSLDNEVYQYDIFADKDYKSISIIKRLLLFLKHLIK